MKLRRSITCCIVLVFCIFITANAQLYKIELNSKTDKASLIVEARTGSQFSFWNDAHTIIYTSTKIHIYKLFKGALISKEIEVITEGGSVDNKCLKVTEVLQLQPGETGMFFLKLNPMKMHSPLTGNILYDVYSSTQGFLRYDETGNNAFAPFASYQNIQQTLFNLIRQLTGIKEKIIDDNTAAFINSGNISNGTAGAVIASFSPATVHAGALNDPANNILTINGSGFGNNPSGAAGIRFKDDNNDHTNPDYKIDYNSPYIISWTDNTITVNVPDRAGTGKFAVVLSDGTAVTSAIELQVFFAVLNAEFFNGKVAGEPRLMNTNGSGGYSFQFSTGTAGGGKDFTTSPAKQTFQRAVATWKEITGANLTEGSPTSLQKIADDGVNLVVFDNDSTGKPNMADGVLESTFSWFSACPQGSGMQLFNAQKTGFDILIRNDPVSTGSDVSFEDGPCFPAQGTYDLEMIILHEIGHALNLAHINDDYENGGGGYSTVNPSKLMHYSILDYVDRRSPDAAAYRGVLYTITQQHNSYGSCGLFNNEMSPLSVTAITNDDCPSSFPATEIDSNTTVLFDLVHATSNKFSDPSFKQVTCNNSGTSVTNNAYYSFYTGALTQVTMDIKNYTTIPADLASCNGQGIKMALYDVQACPQSQAYPQPIKCTNFSSNGNTVLTGLQQNHKYLLYFDGMRNTKASFNVIFNSNGTVVIPGGLTVFPNPVTTTDLNISIPNPSGTAYQYALFDATGKMLLTGKTSASQSPQNISINMSNVASGVYFLRIFDDSGNKVAVKKILKLNK